MVLYKDDFVAKSTNVEERCSGKTRSDKLNQRGVKQSNIDCNPRAIPTKLPAENKSAHSRQTTLT
jgi:hypothetical protein